MTELGRGWVFLPIFWFGILKSWLQTFTSIVVIIILILIGLSRIYLKQQNPSDVVAGYAFGGVWLSLNVLVLELFRFLRRIRGID